MSYYKSNNKKNNSRPNFSGGNNDNRGNNNIEKKDIEIYAPYNFVPVSDKVFKPAWGLKISHDIPMEDGVSGVISVCLTAMTPIFTKDSSSSQDNGYFCRMPDGTYFIPATSLKGCVRNVLEILSFGKMSAVSDNKFETKDFKYNDDLTICTKIPKALLNQKNGNDFKPDMAECIFGYTVDKISLKGRVQFGHAVAVKDSIKIDSNLKSFEAYCPHPSYYPIYSEKGKRWDNKEARIAGRKRYLIQNINPGKNAENSDNQNVNGKKGSATTRVHFIEKSAKFKFEIRFHNLKPVELGALMSALTFHGNNDRCFHNLGFGKAYGYGKVKMDKPVLMIRNYQSETGFVETDYMSYINEFEKQMSAFLPAWRKSVQIRELMAIAGGWDRNVGYMTINEYRKAKKNKTYKYLKPFSELYGNCFRMSPFALNQQVIVECVSEGKIKFKGCDYETTLIHKRDIGPKELVGKRLKVEIKQLNKQGEVTQAVFIALAE